MKTLNIALDVETTGFKPVNSELISLGAVAFTDTYEVLGEFYEECGGFQERYPENVFGRAVDMWPDQATNVHKITFEMQKGFQAPIELYRKLWVFLQQWPDMPIKLIFHASNTIDLDFLFYRSNLYAPKMYQYLRHRTTVFEYEDEGGRDKSIGYSGSTRHDNTMAMARKYNKNGSDALKMAQKHQKQIDKYRNLIYKDRKTPASPAKLAEWRDKMAEAENAMSLMQTNDIAFDGVSLDKLTRGLNIAHDHHSAISDARVLVPIYKFFQDKL